MCQKWGKIKPKCAKTSIFSLNVPKVGRFVVADDDIKKILMFGESFMVAMDIFCSKCAKSGEFHSKNEKFSISSLKNFKYTIFYFIDFQTFNFYCAESGVK